MYKLNLELQSSTNATIVAAAKITGESAEKNVFMQFVLLTRRLWICVKNKFFATL